VTQPALIHRPDPAAGPEPATVLVTLTGADRPGVTAAVFEALARPGVDVLDVE
jgi:phosphoserine phosphatase